MKVDRKEMSAIMAFVRMLGGLLNDSTLGSKIAPIVVDEAHTFSVAFLAAWSGVYNSAKPGAYEINCWRFR